MIDPVEFPRESNADLRQMIVTDKLQELIQDHNEFQEFVVAYLERLEKKVKHGKA